MNCQHCGKKLKKEEIPEGADYGTCDECTEEYMRKIKVKKSRDYYGTGT